MVALDANFIIRFILGAKRGEVPSGDLNSNIALVLRSLPSKKYMIPAPALSEVMANMTKEEMAKFLILLKNSSFFVVYPFDSVCAIEAALAYKKARLGGDKKNGAEGNWQKIKVDYQIASIAKVHNASCIYTNDSDVIKISRLFGIASKKIENIPMALGEKQYEINYSGDCVH